MMAVASNASMTDRKWTHKAVPAQSRQVKNSDTIVIDGYILSLCWRKSIPSFADFDLGI